MHPWLENDCLMADIILPGSTRFEVLDIGNDYGSGTFVSVFLEDHCIDPVGESLSNFDIVTRIAGEAGTRTRNTPSARPTRKNRSLVFEGSGVQELISWEELQKKKYYVIPCSTEVEDVPPGPAPLLRGPEEEPPHHPHGPPRVLLFGIGEALPRRPRASARGRLDREGREPRRAPLQ